MELTPGMAVLASVLGVAGLAAIVSMSVGAVCIFKNRGSRKRDEETVGVTCIVIGMVVFCGVAIVIGLLG